MNTQPRVSKAYNRVVKTCRERGFPVEGSHKIATLAMNGTPTIPELKNDLGLRWFDRKKKR